MPVNLIDGNISEVGIARVGTDHDASLARHKLKPGDIVFSRRGDVTRFALVGNRESGWLCGTGCLKVSLGDSRIATPEFISGVLSLPETKDWLVQHAVGATMLNLNTGILSAIPIRLPDLRTQTEAASLLSSLKSRIDSLRQTNATLEAIAQALFKSWFVDFDPVRAKAEGREPEGMDAATAALFPSEFEDSELGPIPKGWRVRPIYDMADYINGAAYKAFKPNTEHRGLPIIKIAELKVGVTGNTAYSDEVMAPKYYLDDGDILFSWSGNPDTSIDTFLWHLGPALLNQHIFKVVPDRRQDRSFVLTTLKVMRPKFAEIARNKQTTGLGHVTVGDLKAMLVAQPPDGVLETWSEAVDSIVDRVFNNLRQAQSLIGLRDTLLPRLISGKLRLPEAQREVEAAPA